MSKIKHSLVINYLTNLVTKYIQSNDIVVSKYNLFSYDCRM